MHLKSILGTSRIRALFGLSFLSLPLAHASDYAWKNPAAANWSAVNAWLVNGTTNSVQGGPGAADDIVTPTSFSILKIHGNQEINNFTYDSSSAWTIDGETNTQSGTTNRSLIIGGILTKNSTGTLLLRKKAADSFTLTVNNLTMGTNGGNLTFANDITALAVNGAIAIGSGSTFDFGTAFSLQSGKMLSGDGLINANATLSTAGGAIIAPGTGGIGALTLDGSGNAGTVLDATGAVLDFDFAGDNASDRIVINNYSVGDLVLNATLNGTGVVPGTYQLIGFYSDSGTTPATTGDVTGGLTLGAGFAGFTTSISYTAAGISLTVGPAEEPSGYSWRLTAGQPWSIAGGWLIDGTTVSPQGGPGAGDNIVTPQPGSFSTVRLQGDRAINNITYDSSSSWIIAGRTTAGSSDSRLTVGGTLTKNGAGTFTVRRQLDSSFTLTANNITMGANGGNLAFASDITALAVNGDIAIGTNSTFDFGTAFSLRSGKTLSGDGLINANAALSIAGGAIIAPGTGGIGALTFSGSANSGTVLDATGAVLNFDFASGNLSDQIVLDGYSAGDLVLNATLNGTGVVPGAYQLVSFYSDSGAAPATTGDVTGGLTLGTGFAGFTTAVNYTASGITLTVANEDDPGTGDPTDPGSGDPTPPAGDMTWLPAAHRFKESYEAGVIGNRGLQYQMVVAWNQGTADPTKRGWIVTGQDENIVRISKDYGATWSVPRLAGLFCSTMAGLYLDTDDDIFVAVGNVFYNPSNNPAYAGLYYGRSDLDSVRRLNQTRDGKNVFASVANGLNIDRNINCIGRRPQNAAHTLTLAERPLVVIEQPFANGAISAIYVWRGILNPDHTWNWEQVAQLDPAQYVSKFKGIFQVVVAPNGDVLLPSENGAFLCTNFSSASPTFAKIYPVSGDQSVGSACFFGGDENTPSGVRLGVNEANANGGVYETANVRAPDFVKPNGNAGLPANYRVWYLGASPANPDRLAVCTTGGAPYYSTDGGRNFTEVTDIAGSGDQQGRYNVSVLGTHGHAGFYFCPTDEFKCLTPTSQTMARSSDGAVTTNGDLTAFFDGMHTKGVGFHPTDYLEIGRTAQDTGCNLAADGMHWLRGTGTANGTPYNAVVDGTTVATFGGGITAAGGGSESYISGSGICFAPTKDRVVAFFNRSTGGQPNVPVIMENFDSDGKPANLLIKAVGKTLCTNSVVDPKDHTVAFVGRWAVTNLDADNAEDVGFTDHNLHEIIDCFLDADGTTLISYWADVKPGSDTNKSGTAIWRSTDDLGVTGQGDGEAWYTLPQSRYKATAICVDAHQPERVLYVRNDSVSTIREVKRVGDELVDTELVDLSTMPGGVIDTIRAEVGDATLAIPPTPVVQLLCDPNMAGVFYAIIGRHGMPNWWRTVDNGNTWTNISGNAPRTLWTGAVSPLTGDVLGFSSLGEHIHKSPDIEGYPALPHRDAYSNQLEAYFSAFNVKPVIVAATLPHAISGMAYNQPLVATGNSQPFVWSLASGSLPAGLSLSGDGVIGGTPTTSGTSSFTVKVADSDIFSGANDESIQTVELTVESANSVPAITTTTLPGALFGESYGQTFAATGGDGALVWSVATGTLPEGLGLSPDGVLSGSPAGAGVSTFTVSVADSDGITDAADEDSRTYTLTVAPAPASVTLGDLAQGYDGTPRNVSVATNPAGLAVEVTYEGGPVAPANAGAYAVVATVTDPNYVGGATGTLIVTQAPAAVTLGGLIHIYDGTPKAATATTVPSGLPVQLSYNGDWTAPTNAGSYATLAVVTNPNYQGSAGGTLVIAQASALITLGDLAQNYDGAPKVVTATTNPAGLDVEVTYDGSVTAPTKPGTYVVVAGVNSENYAGSVTDTLVVGITALVRHAPTLNGGLDGSIQMLTGENATLNGNSWISGDLLALGTPNVRLNGNPHYAGTIDDTGAVAPAGYIVTLNGNSVLRHVVRRIDSLALPTVNPPPAPAGTVNVTINNSSQSVGNWITLRNLTINGNAGQIAVPTGTYGKFTVNGNSMLILGNTGSSEPAVYNLQGLALNGNSRLTVIGPVIITLAGGINANSSMGDPAHPEWLTLRIASGGLTLNGNVTVSGHVIAPAGTVTINGNSRLTGQVASDRLQINGNGLLEEPDQDN